MTAALASGGTALGQDQQYSYVTENGFLNWNGQSTPDHQDVSVDEYKGFTFNIGVDSVNSPTPILNHRDSLTTITNQHGETMANAPAEFSTGNYLNLSSIQIMGSTAYDFGNVDSIRIIVPASGGTSYTEVSSINKTVDLRDVYDPWLDSPVFQRNVATFSFEGFNVQIGQTYQVLFYDSKGQPVDASLVVTKNGADGFFMLDQDGDGITATDRDFSAAGLTINTTSISNDDVIPEPSTATLSLIALAGLLGRRRRRC